jgi:hypothetical protein
MGPNILKTCAAVWSTFSWKDNFNADNNDNSNDDERE